MRVVQRLAIALCVATLGASATAHASDYRAPAGAGLLSPWTQPVPARFDYDRDSLTAALSLQHGRTELRLSFVNPLALPQTETAIGLSLDGDTWLADELSGFEDDSWDEPNVSLRFTFTW